ncbi:MAG: hypothetical protein QG615_1769 [Nitrospirota bacterium]|nr:hypothetical protein [Nitrospirota bacterium]
METIQDGNNTITIDDGPEVSEAQWREQCKQARLAKRREARKARDEAYRSCGLVKVRGALGGTYWE